MMIVPAIAVATMENITGNEVIDTENHQHEPIRRRETTIPIRLKNKKAMSLKVSSFMVPMLMKWRNVVTHQPPVFTLQSWTRQQLLKCSVHHRTVSKMKKKKMKEKKTTTTHIYSAQTPPLLCLYTISISIFLGKSSKSVKKTGDAGKKSPIEQKSQRTSHKNETKAEKKRQPSAGASKGLPEEKINEKTVSVTMDAEENHKSFEVLPSTDVPIPSKQESSNVSSTKAEADKPAEQLTNENTIVTMADVHKPQPNEQQENSIESSKDTRSNDEQQSMEVSTTKLTVAEEQTSGMPEIKVTRETPEPRGDNQDKNNTVGGSEEQTMMEHVSKELGGESKTGPTTGATCTSGEPVDESKEGNCKTFNLT